MLHLQGAEARVRLIDFGGKKAVVKERFKKLYRLPELDVKLTSKRILQEARSLARCRKAGIDAPTLFLVDLVNSQLYMEFIEGVTVKQHLLEKGESANAENLAKQMGEAIAALHLLDIVHGDLTTSNMMIRQTTGSLVLIDFGLSYTSNLVEDKAVDLYVLERAFNSTHASLTPIFNSLLIHYGGIAKEGNVVLRKLEEVRKRGRKRLQLG